MLTLVRVCRIARSARLRRQVQPRPTGRVSAAFPLSAPSRLRVSRSDARGDAEHAERMSHEAYAFAGVFNPVQQDQSWRELLYMLNLHMFWRKPSSVTPLSIPAACHPRRRNDLPK